MEDLILIRILTVIVLVNFCAVSNAAVYTWIDENGVKNYGDMVPLKYQNQADKENVKVAPAASQPKASKALPKS